MTNPTNSLTFSDNFRYFMNGHDLSRHNGQNFFIQHYLLKHDSIIAKKMFVNFEIVKPNYFVKV